jgi:hypothetical protein
VTQRRGLASQESELRAGAARGRREEFNVPLQRVTRGCNCRSGRNGASIAPMGVAR